MAMPSPMGPYNAHNFLVILNSNQIIGEEQMAHVLIAKNLGTWQGIALMVRGIFEEVETSEAENIWKRDLWQNKIWKKTDLLHCACV